MVARDWVPGPRLLDLLARIGWAYEQESDGGDDCARALALYQAAPSHRWPYYGEEGMSNTAHAFLWERSARYQMAITNCPRQCDLRGPRDCCRRCTLLRFLDLCVRLWIAVGRCWPHHLVCERVTMVSEQYYMLHGQVLFCWRPLLDLFAPVPVLEAQWTTPAGGQADG